MATILLVEDAYFFRIKVRSYLEQWGHKVYEAPDGVAALVAYDNNKPDIVFSDITMPEMDGVTFLKILMDRHPDAKVVMLTSRSDQATLMEALSAGAKNFLIKPFEPEKAKQIILDLMGT